MGLTRIINSNNSMRRAVLNGQSPNQVAYNIIHKNSTNLLTAHMKNYRKKQLLKKANLQTLTYPIIKSKNEDYIYRFYLPPKQFVKEVDFRVSLETYYIKEYTSSQVVLCNSENENETKNTTWQSLVLMKNPFADAPHMEQLKKF